MSFADRRRLIVAQRHAQTLLAWAWWLACVYLAAKLALNPPVWP